MKLPIRCCCCSLRAGAITLGSFDIGLGLLTAIVVSAIVLEYLESERLSLNKFLLFLAIDIGLFIIPGILLVVGAVFWFNWLVLSWLIASISHLILLMIAIVFFPKDVMVPMYKFAVWEGVHPMFDEGDFRYDIVQTFGSGAFAVCIVVEVILIGFIALQLYSSLAMFKFFLQLKDY